MSLPRLLRRSAAAAALAGLAAVVGALAPPRPAAAQPAPPPELPPDLALVPPDALGFVHVRLADVWKNDALREYRRIVERAGPRALAALDEQFYPPPSTVDRVTAVVLPPDGDRPEPLMVAIVRFSKPFDAARVRAAYLPDAKVARAGGKEFFADEKARLAAHFPDDRTLVLSDPKTLPAFLGRPAKGDGPLAKALHEAAAGKALYAAVNVKKLPLPPGFADQVPADLQPLLAAESFTLSADLGKEATVAVRATYATEAEAAAAARALKKAADLGRTLLAEKRRELEEHVYKKGGKTPRPLEELPEALAGVAALGLMNTADEILADPPVRRDGTALAATVTLPAWATQYVAVSAVAAGLALPAVQRVRESAARAQSQNNLKQIALAVISYADANGGNTPPAAIVDKKGKKLLSWRVSILPYLEQQALYNQFHLDEPWDSEHNKKLIQIVPKTYVDPRQPAEPGKTFYKAFVGKDSSWDWVKSKRYPANFPDGTSNTLMVVAAGDPVVWTKPEDVDYDPEKELPDLSKPFGLVLAAFWDGSVRAMSPQRWGNQRKVIWDRLINPNDGQPIPAEAFGP